MKQYFIIGGNGKEYGPVPESEVYEWIKEGRANGDTRIKETEAEEWSLIRNLEQFNLSTLPSKDPEGIPALPNAPANNETRDFNVWSAGCINRGFEVYRNNIGEASLLVLVLLGISVIVNIIFYLALIPIIVGSAAIAMIPVVGIILNLILWTVLPILFFSLFAPLAPGPILFLIRLVRNESARMEDVIAGYTRNAIQCVLAFLIQNVIYHIFVFLGCLLIILLVGWPIVKMVMEAAEAGSGAPTPVLPEYGIMSYFGMLIGILFIIIPIIYLIIGWAYSMILIIDRKMNFWPAMELSRKVVTKHWFQIFFFLIAIGIISSLGVIVCGVGLFFTIPMAMTMFAASYVHIFDERNQGRP